MGRVFCSSDWHSCTFYDDILKWLKPDDKIYFLGDAIDRGDAGIRTFDALYNDSRVTMLKGNHEDLLADFLIRKDRMSQNDWILYYQNGGGSTLESMKNFTKEQEKEYIEKIKQLPEILTYFSPKGHVVILEHAGFSPFTIPHRTHDALWDRQHFYDEWSNGQTYRHFDPETTYLVHGHTPVQFLTFEYGYKGQGAKSAEELKIGNKWDSSEIDYRPQVIRYCDGHKFDIDMCTIVSGRIALLDLDTFEVIYFDEKD